MKGDRLDAAVQSIPSCNGFHGGLNKEQGKSKAYFYMSYSQPPNKSVVKDIMDKLTMSVWPYSTPTAHTGRFKRANPSTSSLSLSAICRPTRTIRRSRRYGNDLECGNSKSKRSADARWHPIYVVGLRAKMLSIILARHGDADRIICVNDPYDVAYSTKDDERDMRVQVKAHVPNSYMKLADSFPARAFKTLLCIVSNKGRLQKIDMQLPARPRTEC